MISTLKVLAGSAVVAGGLVAAAGANAAPIGFAPGAGVDGLVQQVAGGCGPGFFRGPYGGCRPMARRFAPPPPRYYGGRRCFFRPGPFGPVRVCRW